MRCAPASSSHASSLTSSPSELAASRSWATTNTPARRGDQLKRPGEPASRSPTPVADAVDHVDSVHRRALADGLESYGVAASRQIQDRCEGHPHDNTQTISVWDLSSGDQPIGYRRTPRLPNRVNAQRQIRTGATEGLTKRSPATDAGGAGDEQPRGRFAIAQAHATGRRW
jgi:hypothetical protein